MATQKEKAAKYDEQLQRSKASMQRNREAKKKAGLKQYTVWSKAMPKSLIPQGSKVGIAIFSEQALAYISDNNIVPVFLIENGKLVFMSKRINDANTDDRKGGAVQSSPTTKADKA